MNNNLLKKRHKKNKKNDPDKELKAKIIKDRLKKEFIGNNDVIFFIIFLFRK